MKLSDITSPKTINEAAPTQFRATHFGGPGGLNSIMLHSDGNLYFQRVSQTGTGKEIVRWNGNPSGEGFFGKWNPATIKGTVQNGQKVPYAQGQNFSNSPRNTAQRPAARPAANPATPTNGLLRRGNRGDEVKQLQIDLGMTGDEVDGIFGPATEKAVRTFQKNSGAKVDGLVGPETRGMIKKYQKPEDNSAPAQTPPVKKPEPAPPVEKPVAKPEPAPPVAKPVEKPGAAPNRRTPQPPGRDDGNLGGQEPNAAPNKRTPQPPGRDDGNLAGQDPNADVNQPSLMRPAIPSDTPRDGGNPGGFTRSAPDTDIDGPFAGFPSAPTPDTDDDADNIDLDTTAPKPRTGGPDPLGIMNPRPKTTDKNPPVEFDDIGDAQTNSGQVEPGDAVVIDGEDAIANDGGDGTIYYTTPNGEPVTSDTVKPRPRVQPNDRSGRILKRKQQEWDRDYGDTHNPNGTPKEDRGGPDAGVAGDNDDPDPQGDGAGQDNNPNTDGGQDRDTRQGQDNEPNANPGKDDQGKEVPNVDDIEPRPTGNEEGDPYNLINSQQQVDANKSDQSAQRRLDRAEKELKADQDAWDEDYKETHNPDGSVIGSEPKDVVEPTADKETSKAKDNSVEPRPGLNFLGGNINQRRWDKKYADTHNTDGSVKSENGLRDSVARGENMQQTEVTEASINVSANAESAAEVAELMRIMQLSGAPEAKPVGIDDINQPEPCGCGSTEPDHDHGHMDKPTSMEPSMADTIRMISSDYNEEELEDEALDGSGFADATQEPDEKYYDASASVPSGDDLHKSKRSYKATAGGDNPMNTESAIKSTLRKALDEKLNK
jgi:hypothetical protein